MRNFFRHLFFASFLAILLTAIPVKAIEYGGIGGKPAYPRSQEPRSSSVFIHTTQPGEVINEALYVINNTSETKTLMVYSADSTPSSDGGFACKQYSEEKTDVGSWVKLELEEITIPPKDKQLVLFDIKIPQKIEVGEHNGCILIQERKEKSDKAGINLSIRTGLRVALTIPGDIIRKLKIISFDFIKKSNQLFILRPQVENLGNVSIQSDVSVQVKNIFGKIINNFGGEYTILRDDTSIWNYEFIPSIFGGFYRAFLTVNYNDGTNDQTLSTASFNIIAYPTTKGIIIILLFVLPLLAIILFFTFRALAYKREISRWQKYQVRKNDSLDNLARRFNVSWKKIVKVNKIKEPYVLKSGQIISLPSKE